ncbi:MAG: hypothetical protein ABWY07_02810, partial [Burkholderiales bacterium]
MDARAERFDILHSRMIGPSLAAHQGDIAGALFGEPLADQLANAAETAGDKVSSVLAYDRLGQGRRFGMLDARRETLTLPDRDLILAVA